MSAPLTHHLGTLAILPPELRKIIYENILRDVRITYASSRSTTSPIPLLHVNRALCSLTISTIKRTKTVLIKTHFSLQHLATRHITTPLCLHLRLFHNLHMSWSMRPNGLLRDHLLGWKEALHLLHTCRWHRCTITLGFGFGEPQAHGPQLDVNAVQDLESRWRATETMAKSGQGRKVFWERGLVEWLEDMRGMGDGDGWDGVLIALLLIITAR
jgi:hypothetical protein